MFPGQGAQHPGMARGLYDTEPVFAEHFDACVAGFRDELGIDLHAMLFGAAAKDWNVLTGTHPRCSPWNTRWPSWLTAMASALGRYRIQHRRIHRGQLGRGFRPRPRSSGVIAGRLMHESAPGAMVAVALSPDDIAEYLSTAWTVRGQRSRQLCGRRAEAIRASPHVFASMASPPVGSARPTRSIPAQWIPSCTNFRTSCPS